MTGNDHEEWQKERGVREHRDDADRDAERHRTGVAHEKFRRINIAPEEREQRADHHAAERGELIAAEDERDNGQRDERKER